MYAIALPGEEEIPIDYRNVSHLYNPRPSIMYTTQPPHTHSNSCRVPCSLYSTRHTPPPHSPEADAVALIELVDVATALPVAVTEELGDGVTDFDVDRLRLTVRVAVGVAVVDAAVDGVAVIELGGGVPLGDGVLDAVTRLGTPLTLIALTYKLDPPISPLACDRSSRKHTFGLFATVLSMGRVTDRAVGPLPLWVRGG